MLTLKLRRVLAAFFLKAKLTTLIFLTIAYALSSYYLLLWSGESKLIAFDQFIYWLIVTASTVGYGDYSPATYGGKLVVSLWVIPLGLSLFAIVLAHFGYHFSQLALKGKKGLRMLSNENHYVIIGWNGQRTLRLIELLIAKTNGKPNQIVLCVVKDIDNPLPGQIDFVKAESFTHPETMARANLPKAKSIIIDTPLDDVTLTTALFCNKVSPKSHKTAYFQDDSVGALLKETCPSIEIIPSVSVELLAKSSMDPGSSHVFKQLLDTTSGMTQYAIQYSNEEAISFADLFNHFKTELAATLIGIQRADSEMVELNPKLTETIYCRDNLIYISNHRLSRHDCFSKIEKAA